MTRTYPRWLAPTAVAAGLIAISLLSSHLETRQKQRVSVSTRVQDAVGLSVAADVLSKLSPAVHWRISGQPMLEDSYFKDVGTLLIASPQTPFLEREAALVRKFVEDGGTLLLFFHGETSWQFLKPLIRELNLPLNIDDSPLYQPQTASPATADTDTLLFRKGEHYEFYTSSVLSLTDCSSAPFQCFVFSRGLGRGHVEVVASIAPFANRLVGAADNRLTLQRLSQLPGPLVVDEHRHFYDERTKMDLIREPVFIFPLIASVLCVLLYLIFAYRPAEIAEPLPAPDQERTLHRLNSAILHHALQQKALRAQAYQACLAVLERLFPTRGRDIEDLRKNTATVPVATLVQKHAQWKNEYTGGSNHDVRETHL